METFLKKTLYNFAAVCYNCRWENKQGDYIIFEQHILDGYNYSMDSEYGQTSVVICGEFEVYCLISDISFYTWNDGTYAYQICSSETISDNELAQMISELQIVK